MPDFEVRAVSASTPESGKRAAETFNIPIACADAASLVRRDDVDLVVITVKVPHHFELVTAALESGKAVLCEWPLGNGLEEAEILTRLAAERALPTFVGLQARSSPAVRFLRQLVTEGAIGEVLSSSVVASGLRYGATTDSTREYLLNRTNGASMLEIPFAHTVDGLTYVLGEFSELTATTARRRTEALNTTTNTMVPMTVDDQIAVSGILSGGPLVSIHYRGGLSRGTNFLWEINGTDGDIVATAETGHLQFGLIDIKITDSSGALVPREVPLSLRKTDASPTSWVHAVAEAYAHIANDMKQGTRTAPSFSDGLRRHQMIDAVERSATTGTRQILDL